jgi:hypothetical protein
MTKLTRAACGALAALTCVALTVDVRAQGRTGRSGAPGPQPQARSGGPATPPAAASIADDPLSGPVVTNAPFSADAVTTITQILSDGTRIEQTTTARFYRDSAGRVRSEQTVLGLGALDPSSQPRTTITVMTEPDNRAMYTLDPVNKTARRGADVRAYFALSASSGTVSVGATPTAAYTVTLDAANRERERRAVTVQNGLAAVQGRLTAVRITDADGNAVRQPDEALGMRQVEGVSAVGRRTKSIIPTGKIGNDRPIEITDERWESADLRLLVRSHHRDPRTGDVEYRLTNIVRAEPPSELFTIPSDYTVLNDTLNGTPGVRLGGPAPVPAPAGGGGFGAGARTGGARQGGTPAN